MIVSFGNGKKCLPYNIFFSVVVDYVIVNIFGWEQVPNDEILSVQNRYLSFLSKEFYIIESFFIVLIIYMS